MEAWLHFCSRHALPNFGMPAEEDTLGWLLREEDASAGVLEHRMTGVTPRSNPAWLVGYHGCMTSAVSRLMQRGPAFAPAELREGLAVGR